MDESTQDETEQTETSQPDTYVGMFDQYTASLTKIAPSDRPLIFHARKLCQQLDKMIDGKGSTEAAKDSAYLQAIERLHKRLSNVPGPPDPENGKGVPGQEPLFGFHDDGDD